jgi:hypothetical protein
MNREAMVQESNHRPGRSKAEICSQARDKAAAAQETRAASAQLGDHNSGLALPSLEAPLGLIDHVDAALTAHDTVVAVTPAQRFQ